MGPSYPEHSLEEGAELLDGYISLDSWNPYHMGKGWARKKPKQFILKIRTQVTYIKGWYWRKVVKVKYAPKFLAH